MAASFSFGVFKLDRSVPELQKSGRRVHLQDVPLRALEILLQHPGELVTRETFFQRLWPHDSSGILDDNLNTAIRKLRLALNDSAHHPRFIETVPKRGYRFVAPVQVIDDEPPTSPPGHPVRRRFIVPVITAGLLALGVWLTYLAVSDRNAPALVEPGMQTVAVLPFVNASNDPERDYFSDGLTEEIMDRLAVVDGLRVVSRTSAYALRDTRLDAHEIGERLGADALVEGSIRWDNDQLRISARLVNADDGLQLWSQRYERGIDDLFAVQRDIASSVAAALGAEQSDAEAAMQRVAVPTNTAAYDEYLKGRNYWHKRSNEGLHAAVRHFDAALRLAPDYARAWAGLADAYAVLGFYDYLPPAEAFPKAREAAERALALDPDNADAEANLGYVALYYGWDLPIAEQHFRASIAMQPDSSKAHQWYANLLTAAGRFDEAEREMRLAQQLEPLSLIASAALGWVYYFAGDSDAALAQLDQTLSFDDEFELAYLWKAWTCERQGDFAQALEYAQRAAALSGNSGISVATLARLHALLGEAREARRLLTELQADATYLPAYEIAKAYFALGDQQAGADWLRRAAAEHSHSLVFLDVDPQLVEQRDEPVVRELSAKIRR